MDEEKPYFKLSNDRWISGPQDFCILCLIVSEKRLTMRMAEYFRFPVFYYIIYYFREEAGIEDGWEPQAAGFLYSIFYRFREEAENEDG